MDGSADIIFDDDGVIITPNEIAEEVLKKTRIFVETNSKVKLLLQHKSVIQTYRTEGCMEEGDRSKNRSSLV